VNTRQQALSEYLAARRALGTRLVWPESCLCGFVRFAEAEGAQFITTELALRWALQSKGVQRATHARRLGIVRRSAAWLQPTDTRNQVPPDRLLPAQRRRPAPHIFSTAQIDDLMTAAWQLGSKSGLRGTTFHALIGRLAASGLRPGEALALDTDDVDLVDDVISVRDSKFGKSRVVPVDVSVSTALTRYARLRDASRPPHETPAFLVTSRGTRLTGHTARRTFADLCQVVGLRPPLRNRA
jgi:site-specific recombinase XerD